MLYLPHSSHGATGHAAGAPTSDVGWEASRRRAQAIGSKGRRPPPRAPRAQRPESGTRHSAGIAGTPLATREATLPAVRCGLAKASRGGLRVLHFSVQRDHLHLLVEAVDGCVLSRGLQGLAIRIAKAVNRVLGRRGRVFSDRFHAHALRTPREVRNALVYVLQNWAKHTPGARGLDA